MEFKKEIYNNIKQQLTNILTFTTPNFTSNINENIVTTPLIFIDIPSFKIKARDLKIVDDKYIYYYFIEGDLTIHYIEQKNKKYTINGLEYSNDVLLNYVASQFLKLRDEVVLFKKFDATFEIVDQDQYVALKWNVPVIGAYSYDETQNKIEIITLNTNITN